MLTGIIGTKSRVKNTITKYHLINIVDRVHITNTTRRIQLDELNLNHAVIDNNLLTFLKNSDHLIVDSEHEQEVIEIIKKWSVYHHEGTIILRQIFHLGFSDKVHNWLRNQGKEVSVINYPRISTYILKNTKLNYFLLGGDYQKAFIKVFRRKIVKVSKLPILLTTNKETEFIYLSNMMLYLAYNSTLLELEDIARNQQIDPNVIIKGLSQFTYYNRNKLKPADISSLTKSFSKGSRLLDISIDKFIDYQGWFIKELSKLKKRILIRKVAIIGYPNKALLERLNRLSIQNISFYSLNKQEFNQNARVKFEKNPYTALKNADVMVLLDFNDFYASISLQTLKKLMNKKIIIDQVNAYELNELKAQGWVYITKSSL